MSKDVFETVCQSSKCTGCYSCVELCPCNAIHMEKSINKYEAIIDAHLCINCGLCKTRCPENSSPITHKVQKWQQGWAKNNICREIGASGGIATAISKCFIQSGGIVCSCSFEKGEFTFSFHHTIDTLYKQTGSKYVKSNAKGIYREIKQLLKSSRLLFIGLPCQVAGLINFIGEKEANNLYTIDLICHGTPSPEALGVYLSQYSLSTSDMNDVKFRNKGIFQVANGEKGIITNGVCDKYMIAFLKGITYTENCYSCRYASLERVSDITLGDSWGSDLSEEEKKKGISLILCQTEKGKELIDSSDLYLQDVDVDKAIKNNHQLTEPSRKPGTYNAFFEGIKSGSSFNKMVYKAFPLECLKQDLKELLIRAGLY